MARSEMTDISDKTFWVNASCSRGYIIFCAVQFSYIPSAFISLGLMKLKWQLSFYTVRL